MPRTKISATIGPASDSPVMLRALVLAGMSVARLNASHTPRADLERRLAAVRAAADDAGRPVAVMLDLGGPKLRLGEVEPNTQLVAGERFELLIGSCIGDARRACVTYEALATDVPDGSRVLLDDGRIELVVIARRPDALVTEVLVGGPLGSHKGVNLPGVSLSIDAITDKDREDLAWGLAAGVDLIAQSFVREPGDITRLRDLMGDRVIPIVAKIEKHEAVAVIDDIVAVADAVMVARGDLAVETATEQVPVVQRRIVAACRQAGKPVIVATQMLESMTAAARPTRAEASDVANAIFTEVDAVMLSAETAVGAYPLETVQTMVRIAAVAEESLSERPSVQPAAGGCYDVTSAVSTAVYELACDLELAAIVTATQSGATARAVAAHRPRTPILAVTPDAAVARRLALVWGVVAIVVPQHDTIDDMLAYAVGAVRDAGFALPGQLIALTGGVAVGVPGTTNLLQVTRV
ncbi:MAG: pyruvate kinase [Actinomycetota bacterium]|nr:pyruvate kinase [Actinomycetota bacterium]